MNPHKPSIAWWQWPNLLALDTACIVMLWAGLFAHLSQRSLSISQYAILGLSTWVAYQADRLLDVRSKPKTKLLTRRHQFAQQHMRTLWPWLLAATLLNLAIAGSQLSYSELQKGTWLLGAVLAYTYLIQQRKKKYGLKEASIAGIISASVILFVPTFSNWGTLSLFTWLCFLNCALITKKEAAIDRALTIETIAPQLSRLRLWLLTLIPIGLLTRIENEIQCSLIVSFLLLASLYWQQKRLHPELYRVLADSALLLGPLLAYGFKNIGN